MRDSLSSQIIFGFEIRKACVEEKSHETTSP